MAYNIKQNWLKTLELIVKRPILLLPFIVIAFLEGLVLELIYFSTRRPISFIASPIIGKFFGESFTHYPGNLLALPGLFYYVEIALYVVVGIFLTAIAINIFKNIKLNLPLKPNALIKNAAKRYLSFFLYGILAVTLALLLKKADTFLLFKFFRSASQSFPNATVRFAPFITPLVLFATNIVMQVFLILIIPIMVIEKRALLKAFARSFYHGARNFMSLFILLFIPSSIYLPISLLKRFSVQLANLAFPEINLYIAGTGIIASMFINAFVMLCASQFLLDKEEK